MTFRCVDKELAVRNFDNSNQVARKLFSRVTIDVDTNEVVPNCYGEMETYFVQDFRFFDGMPCGRKYYNDINKAKKYFNKAFSVGKLFA